MTDVLTNHTRRRLVVAVGSTASAREIEDLLASAGTVTDSFTIFQTDSGTYPTADSQTDTLTLTSSDSSVTIIGDAATDTIDLAVSTAFTDNYYLRLDGANSPVTGEVWFDYNVNLYFGDPLGDGDPGEGNGYIYHDGDIFHINGGSTGNVRIDTQTFKVQSPNVYQTFTLETQGVAAVGYAEWLMNIRSGAEYLSIKINDTGSIPASAVEISTSLAAGYFVFNKPVEVPNDAYGAGWDGSLEVPTKDAIYDQIEALSLVEADTLDTVCDRGAITDQIIQVGGINDNAGPPVLSVDTNTRQLLDVAGNLAVDWSFRSLYYWTGSIAESVMAWDAEGVYFPFGIVDSTNNYLSVDTENRKLNSTDNSVNADWSTLGSFIFGNNSYVGDYVISLTNSNGTVNLGLLAGGATSYIDMLFVPTSGIADNTTTPILSVDNVNRALMDTSGAVKNIDWSDSAWTKFKGGLHIDALTTSGNAYSKILFGNPGTTPNALFDFSDTHLDEFTLSRNLHVQNDQPTFEPWLKISNPSYDGDVKIKLQSYNAEGIITFNAYTGDTYGFDFNYPILDSVGVLSADFANRKLYYSSGTNISVDWENSYLYQSAGLVTVDWDDQVLKDAGGGNAVALDWASRKLYYVDGTTLMMNWNDLAGGTPAVGFGTNTNRLLIEDVGIMNAYDKTIDLPNAKFKIFGSDMISWAENDVVHSVNRVKLHSGILDTSSYFSIDNNARILYAGNGTTSMLDWSTANTINFFVAETATKSLVVKGNTYDMKIEYDVTNELFEFGWSNGDKLLKIDSAMGAGDGLYVSLGDYSVASLGSYIRVNGGTGSDPVLEIFKGSATYNHVEWSGGLIDNDGNVEVTGTNGFILESPDTTRWKITVDDNGALTTTSI